MLKHLPRVHSTLLVQQLQNIMEPYQSTDDIRLDELSQIRVKWLEFETKLFKNFL